MSAEDDFFRFSAFGYDDYDDDFDDDDFDDEYSDEELDEYDDDDFDDDFDDDDFPDEPYDDFEAEDGYVSRRNEGEELVNEDDIAGFEDEDDDF